MKKGKIQYKLAILFIILSLSLVSKGQTVSYWANNKDRITKDTLIDKTTGIKFILDKARINITAIDKVGKVIWKTDPATDNKLEEYRVKRPTIIYFSFGFDKTKEKNEVIYISYNNSQSGYLDKKNGKFKFEGQD